MHATDVLAGQHEAIMVLFDAVEAEVEAVARELAVGRLAEEIIAHMAGEETVFYPALRRLFSREPEDERVARAIDEHAALKVALRGVLAGSVDDEAFEGRIASLRAMFEEHARAEETRIFPRVDSALGDADHEVLGAEILGSRPPIWMVVPERAPRAGATMKLRSRVSLPLP